MSVGYITTYCTFMHLESNDGFSVLVVKTNVYDISSATPFLTFKEERQSFFGDAGMDISYLNCTRCGSCV